MQLSTPIILIKKSLAIFFQKKNLTYFLLVMTPAVLAQLLWSIYSSTLVPPQGGDLLLAVGSENQFLFYIFGAIYLIVSFLIMVLPYEAIVRVVKGQPLSFKESLISSFKKSFPYFIISVLLTLSILFGFVALIIPGIIFLVWFSFAQVSFVSEGTSIFNSFSQSKKLVKGRFFKVLGWQTVILIFVMFTSLILTLIPYVGVYIVTFLTPIFSLPLYLLYLELKSSPAQ